MKWNRSLAMTGSITVYRPFHLRRTYIVWHVPLPLLSACQALVTNDSGMNISLHLYCASIQWYSRTVSTKGGGREQKVVVCKSFRVHDESFTGYKDELYVKVSIKNTVTLLPPVLTFLAVTSTPCRSFSACVDMLIASGWCLVLVSRLNPQQRPAYNTCRRQRHSVVTNNHNRLHHSTIHRQL